MYHKKNLAWSLAGVGRDALQFDSSLNREGLGQSVEPTLEKSDNLGTKSRRKRLWDYLGGRRSKQTRGI